MSTGISSDRSSEHLRGGKVYDAADFKEIVEAVDPVDPAGESELFAVVMPAARMRPSDAESQTSADSEVRYLVTKMRDLVSLKSETHHLDPREPWHSRLRAKKGGRKNRPQVEKNDP